MADPARGPTLVAVGGGKGGVGKSFVASSLAIALARRDSAARIVAVDLDLGGSNLNLFLGEPTPRAELTDFLDGRVESLEDVAQATRIPNLRYVAGSFDMVTAVDPLRTRKLDLVRGLVGLDADFVVLDLPAGSTPATLDFYFLGDVKLVVTNPEATAFHNAYGFLKNYALRRLLTEFRDRKDVLGSILEYYRGPQASPEDADRTVTGLVDVLRERYPETWAEVLGILDDDAPLLVLNRARSRAERHYLTRFQEVVKRFLGLGCPPLGTIPEERRVSRAVRAGRPFVLAHPRHGIARQFDGWAERLVQSRGR